MARVNRYYPCPVLCFVCGVGYMWDYPIAKALADGRVARIYGGTNEIMKELIARGI